MDPALFWVPFAAVLAPPIAAFIGRALVVPMVVIEIALGMLLGPAGVGWVQDGQVLESYSQLGLAMLFFMAGNEIDLRALRGSTGARALGGWGITAVLALVAGLVVADGPAAAVIIAIALSGTALGTISPIMRDSGLDRGPIGAAITASGAMGEFLPLVAITVFLSGKSPIVGIGTLVLFVAAAGFAFVDSARKERPGLLQLVSQTLHTSGQFAIRIVIVLLAALVALALLLGVDFMLGAFTAGLLARLVLRGSPSHEREQIDSKLEAIAFGFFVPIFFVSTGVTFPLAEVVGNPATLALVPMFALVMLLVRGIPGFFTPARGTSVSGRTTSALFTATTLSLVIAVTKIGVDSEVLDPALGAALTGGAMLTVLLFPMIGVALHRRETSRAAQ